MQVDYSGPQRESRVLLAFSKILCQDLLTDPFSHGGLPYLFGFNEVKAKENAEVLATANICCW
jgi:uncharacterized membrane protein